MGLDLLPANLDLRDAADRHVGANVSGTDTGGPELLRAQPVTGSDPVLQQAAEVGQRQTI